MWPVGISIYSRFVLRITFYHSSTYFHVARTQFECSVRGNKPCHKTFSNMSVPYHCSHKIGLPKCLAFVMINRLANTLPRMASRLEWRFLNLLIIYLYVSRFQLNQSKKLIYPGAKWCCSLLTYTFDLMYDFIGPPSFEEYACYLHVTTLHSPVSA